MNDVTLKVTESARKRLDVMELHTSRVRSTWGRHRPDLVLKQETSLHTVLGRIMGMGGTLSIDGTMGLFLSSGMAIGIVPRSQLLVDHAGDDLPSVGAYPDGTPYLGKVCWARTDSGLGDGSYVFCHQPVYNGEPRCTGHEPLTMGTPIPVEWSMHS